MKKFALLAMTAVISAACTLELVPQDKPAQPTEDTGCGVPVEEAENIFGRFVKLDSFKQGIGLGLPLSRKLAEQLGGTVTLDTSYHPGARFIITLPIKTEDKKISNK